MKHLLIPVLLVISIVSVSAQTCSYFPADCPGDMNSKDPEFCKKQFIVPQEITMQNQLRDAITALMETQAKDKNWEVYEFDEIAYGSFIKPPNDHDEAYAVPFPHRPPHVFSICFVFIVNSDSLKAWKDWYYNAMMDKSNKLGSDYTAAISDPSFQAAEKKYMDSADYWNTQLADFMTKNIEDYQKASVSGDKPGIRKYEEGLKFMQTHVNYWTDKIVKGSNNATAASDSEHAQFYKDVHLRREQFRNNSMIRVKFVFNNDDAFISESPDMHFIKQIPNQNCTLAQLYHNNNTSNVSVYALDGLDRSTDIALLLYGNWVIPTFRNTRFYAQYTLDKKNTDRFSQKKIACDQLQTISMSVEGSPFFIDSFLSSLDTEKINRLLVKD